MLFCSVLFYICLSVFALSWPNTKTFSHWLYAGAVYTVSIHRFNFNSCWPSFLPQMTNISKKPKRIQDTLLQSFMSHECFLSIHKVFLWSDLLWPTDIRRLVITKAKSLTNFKNVWIEKVASSSFTRFSMIWHDLIFNQHDPYTNQG